MESKMIDDTISDVSTGQKVQWSRQQRETEKLGKEQREGQGQSEKETEMRRNRFKKKRIMVTSSL